MNSVSFFDFGFPSLLSFSGNDSVRFLNGQITQDVRQLIGAGIALPSCVTDAKGRLQFRVMVMEGVEGELWVEGVLDSAADLLARLTRYLIADDVEVVDRSGSYRLIHFMGDVSASPAGVLVRQANRFGVNGNDWWVPCEQVLDLPDGARRCDGPELDDLRIRNGIPSWGHELVDGMLPPEALLEATDISYHKGCYIGQEVISRIKAAGKVNRRLTRFTFDADAPLVIGPLVNAVGDKGGEITSVASHATGELRCALGYLRRGTAEVFFRGVDGTLYPAKMV